MQRHHHTGRLGGTHQTHQSRRRVRTNAAYNDNSAANASIPNRRTSAHLDQRQRAGDLLGLQRALHHVSAASPLPHVWQNLLRLVLLLPGGREIHRIQEASARVSHVLRVLGARVRGARQGLGLGQWRTADAARARLLHSQCDYRARQRLYQEFERPK